MAFQRNLNGQNSLQTDRISGFLLLDLFNFSYFIQALQALLRKGSIQKKTI